MGEAERESLLLNTVPEFDSDRSIERSAFGTLVLQIRPTLAGIESVFVPVHRVGDWNLARVVRGVF